MTVSPGSGPIGTTVIITGTGLAGATGVSFNGVKASVTVASPTSITTTVPTGATTGPISVTTAQGAVVSAGLFTVMQPVSKVDLSASPSTQSIATGQSASYTITLARTNFTGAVDLAVSGLPAGVTAAFSPDPTTGDSSVLTINTAANTAPGTSILTISGAALGITIAPLTVNLIVTPAPSVRLSATPTVQNVTVGQSASYTIALERTNFTGLVHLAVSGLPAGATASFNPDPTAGNRSILTVNTVAGTVAGTSVLTISGSASGAPVTSTTVSMTVNLAPSVRLSAMPAAQSIVAGQSTSYTITLDRTNFTGPVNLAVSGLPTGATAAFSPNPATGTSGVLTVTTAASTPGGSYNLTLSGSAAGAIVTPAAVSLTVTALVTLSASPSTVSVRAGESASYTVILNRSNLTGAVPLAVSGLPLGATVVLNPGFTTGNSAALVVNTAPTTAPGTYTLTLTGTSQNALLQSTTVGLAVTSNLPVITGFTPASGPVGTSVTIVGANFTQVTGVRFTTGAFNTLLDANFTVNSPTAITTFVPFDAITGPISVTTPQGTASSASPFTVVAPKDKEKEKESEGGKLLKDRRDGKGFLTEGAFQTGGGLPPRATEGPAAPAGRLRHFIGQDLRPDLEDSALKGEPDLIGPAAPSIVPG